MARRAGKPRGGAARGWEPVPPPPVPTPRGWIRPTAAGSGGRRGWRRGRWQWPAVGRREEAARRAGRRGMSAAGRRGHALADAGEPAVAATSPTRSGLAPAGSGGAPGDRRQAGAASRWAGVGFAAGNGGSLAPSSRCRRRRPSAAARDDGCCGGADVTGLRGAVSRCG
ncbi:hypothetical protein DAI22_05g007100 [Oryza sativa Japonica Group]|nr:hypothetical protein DAI22_05g007100 [Oryza sativa Japonica Group]